MRNLLTVAAAASGLMLCVAANAAEVDKSSGPASPTATPPQDSSGVPVNIRPTGPPVVLEIGKGTLFHLPRPAATVFVANPDVADVQVKSPTLLYISANKTKPGETVVYAVDGNDNVLVSAVIRVEYDLSRLRQSYKQTMPGERVSVSSVESKLVLSGEASSAGQAEKARALAIALIGGDKAADLVVNQLSVVTPNQVNLRVRIAEVQRTVLKQLGFNWSRFGDPTSHFTFTTANPTSGVAPEIIGTAVTNTAFFNIGKKTADHLLGTLDLLAQEGLVTTLAEPNMTAMNGQTASFLVGGSFPVLTSINPAQALGGVTTIGIPYKDFGVKLDFTPTIIDANHLNLKMRPEVSALSTAGAISVPLTGTAAITIPALTVTRAETTLELGSGQSFALAGLLRHDTTQDISKVPALGDIPILGQLFRSDGFNRNETELVIIFTPYLVNPVATASAMAPTDGYVPAHDLSR